MKSTKALTFTSVLSSSYPAFSFDQDWTWLPQNLLLLVLNKLLLLSDMIRFASVCRHWRSVAKDRFQQLNLRANMQFTRKLPMLLVPSTENNPHMSNLFNITHEEIYDLRLPVPYTKRYCGSSHGWLIILDNNSFVVTLINPFYFGNSKGIIHLPQFIAALDACEELGQDFDCEYFITKAVLSSDPITSPNGYSLMLIYGEMRMLSLWKSGDTHWTYITWSATVFNDLIYSRGQFLAVNTLGQVFSCDTNVRPPNLSRVSRPLLCAHGNFCRRYIVELPDGTIVQIIRILRACVCNKHEPSDITLGFVLYKLDNNGTEDWFSVQSLGEGALFLGDSCSLYVNTSQLPGCGPNSVYFTDDYQDADVLFVESCGLNGCRDIGVFHLDTEEIDRILCPLFEKRRFAPPIWINPTI